MTVDAATGVLVRFDELSDAGPIVTRALHIGSVDTQVETSPCSRCPRQ